MTKIGDFGTWEPDFPDLLLVATAVIAAPKSRKTTVHTFPRAFKTPKEMADYIETVMEQYHLDPKADPIKFGPIYISMLRYSRAIELKREYWTGNKHAEFAPIRQNLFADMLASDARCEDWQMVITPEGKKGKKQYFSAGMPVRGEKIMADVEAFMKYSDWHVDPTAAHAAFYSVVEEVVFDWVTEPKRSRKKTLL